MQHKNTATNYLTC